MSVTAFHNGNSARFGDSPVAFSIARFEHHNKDHPAKWFFSVSRYIGRDALIEAEMTPANLREMARWLERAAEMVASDGKRLEAKGTEA